MRRTAPRGVLGYVPFAVLMAAASIGASTIASVRADGPPPPATFTPNARADAAETGNGQNEPQVAVDQTGRAYIDWQSSTNSNGTSAASSTTDGVHFDYLGVPDDHTNVIDGDVDIATTSWPAIGLHTPSVPGSGDNGVFFGHLNSGACAGASLPGFPPDIQIRDATSNDGGAHWAPTDASCAPFQVDRPWVAAYTPPAFRGTSGAVSHTEVFNEYHDFGSSEIFVTRSFNGGATYDPVQYLGINQSSPENPGTFCNSIPSGIAVDQRGAHAGRVYVIWETGDTTSNTAQGCDYTQAQAFDHVFLSYSDDIGNPACPPACGSGATPSWTSTAVWNDPCAPTPGIPPTDPTSCQDVSELFNSLAVDDAGNVYVAFIHRDPTAPAPEYDIDLETSSDGGNTFTRHQVNPDGDGTHYEPWVTAGGNGGVDVVYYRTPYVESTNFAMALNKPQAAPSTAVWDVYMAQSLDGGNSFTIDQVSDASDTSGGVYFGDICTTGIFCSATPPTTGWGADRILFDDFGVAIGPDGGARIIWTDARSSHTGACTPGGMVSCQSTHVMFACQTGGKGLHGETITGCGTTLASSIPDSRWAPALPLAGVAALGVAATVRRKRGRRIASTGFVNR
jgi:hypothetical protein